LNLKQKGADSLAEGVEPLRNLLLASTGSFSHGYHLEFAIEEEQAAHALCERLAEHDIFANISGAEGHIRVYIKDSESICNLLALVGANSSLYKLNDRIAMRSVRNVTNRRANCDNANIARQIETAAHQISALENLVKSGGFKTLPTQLQKTAIARIENPEAALEELAKILGISKSGVVHRMKRLLRNS